MKKSSQKAERLRARIFAFMAARELEVQPWCNKAGHKETMLRHFLSGYKTSITTDVLSDLADAADVTVGYLMGENTGSSPVIADIKDGLRFFPLEGCELAPYATHPKVEKKILPKLGEIKIISDASPAESAIGDFVSGIMQDDSELPLFPKGSKIEYNRADIQFDNFDVLLEEHCVIGLSGNEAVARFLDPGKDGKYNLRTYRGIITHRDVKPQWAVKIHAFLPASRKAVGASLPAPSN